jgi:hypothetical protein
MSAREKEKHLKKPVFEFLKGLGCDKLKFEVLLVDRGVDVYGIKTGQSSRSFAVELKLRDWQKALRQAAIYQLCADYCYVAMPNKRAIRLDRAAFREAGVGLLAVDMASRVVTILCGARKSAVKRTVYSEFLEGCVRG